MLTTSAEVVTCEAVTSEVIASEVITFELVTSEAHSRGLESKSCEVACDPSQNLAIHANNTRDYLLTVLVPSFVCVLNLTLLGQATLKQLSRQLVHLRERQHHLREDLRANPASSRYVGYRRCKARYRPAPEDCLLYTSPSPRD